MEVSALLPCPMDGTQVVGLGEHLYPLSRLLSQQKQLPKACYSRQLERRSILVILALWSEVGTGRCGPTGPGCVNVGTLINPSSLLVLSVQQEQIYFMELSQGPSEMCRPRNLGTRKAVGK